MSSFLASVSAFYDRQVAEVVKQVVDEAYIEIMAKSPVDTGTFLAQNRKTGVEIKDGVITASVVNQGEYSERVEGGFRKTPVNWHLRDGSIFYNKGAETFQKSTIKAQARLVKLLKS